MQENLKLSGKVAGRPALLLGGTQPGLEEDDIQYSVGAWKVQDTWFCEPPTVADIVKVAYAHHRNRRHLGVGHHRLAFRGLLRPHHRGWTGAGCTGPFGHYNHTGMSRTLESPKLILLAPRTPNWSQIRLPCKPATPSIQPQKPLCRW